LPKTFKISYAVSVNSVVDDDILYIERQIKYLTDTQYVHHYKQFMRLIEQQIKSEDKHLNKQ
jgi:hypothetical protein